MAAEFHGIHSLPIPTPFAVGPVNAFLIEDEPLTLIDCGPASTRSLQALEAALRGLGRSVQDIELLVLTHQHLDHLGLAGYLSTVSDVEVVCLDRLARYVERFDESAAAEDDFAAQLMALHGVPSDTIAALERVAALTRNWGAPVGVGRALAGSSVIELASRSLRLIHAPGHSPTDTLFLDEANGILFGGDHLIATISSNALVSRSWNGDQAGDGSGRRRALMEYIGSLRATRELELSIVYTGHGPPVPDHRTLIDRRLASYGRRLQQIVTIVGEQALTAHGIAESIWGGVAISQAFLTLSEVLGHLDLLIEDGAIVEQQRADGGVVYRRA